MYSVLRTPYRVHALTHNTGHTPICHSTRNTLSGSQCRRNWILRYDPTHKLMPSREGRLVDWLVVVYIHRPYPVWSAGIPCYSAVLRIGKKKASAFRDASSSGECLLSYTIRWSNLSSCTYILRAWRFPRAGLPLLGLHIYGVYTHNFVLEYSVYLLIVK